MQGQSRFRVLEFLDGWPFLVARVAIVETAEESSAEIEARFLQLKERAVEAIQLLPNVPDELVGVVQAMNFARAACGHGRQSAGREERGEAGGARKLRPQGSAWTRCSALLGERVEVLKLSKEIGDKTRKEFDERQREHVLREQMRQIQKELGEDGESAAEIDDLKKAIDEAGMPEDTLKHARKELKRLERMGEGSAEGSMLRTYLEWLSELPWKVSETGKPIDIAQARKVLDEDHYGLEKIKRRILEYLAVRKLNPDGKSPILCFVGPPGVGKTSLGQSIARATGRKFQRVALGGTHDEAEIRGHRRTYIGALPGNIIQAIRRAESRTGVLHARRNRQARRGRFPRRPVERAAGGARSGAELQVPRQLPRRGLRLVEGDVHRHGEPARHDSGTAARSHGGDPASGLHRGREARDRPALPGEAPARSQRTQAGTGRR